MNEDTEAREFVFSELDWLQDFLHEKFGLSVREVKRTIRQMLEWCL